MRPKQPQASGPISVTEAIRQSLADSSVLDEAFLACTDGHCVFNDDGYLLAWSDSFTALYPTLNGQLKIGLQYDEFLRKVVSHCAIKNLPNLAGSEQIDHWIADHMAQLGNSEFRFIHHLLDDRYMLIKHLVLSNGYWFFAAFDITELHRARRARSSSEQKFSDFAKLSSDWFWELDENLCYRYHSSHNAPLGGTDASQLVGKSRVIDVGGRVVVNDQMRLHNRNLQERREVNVVLTWRNHETGVQTHSHVLARPQYDDEGQFTGYLGCGRDITAAYQLKREYEYQAKHDDLTGLLNRRAFGNYLDQLLADLASRANRKAHTLICIDLDQFKLVNDSAGHPAGDQLLKEITTILRQELGERCVLARLGGDEFIAVLECNASSAIKISNQIISSIGRYRFFWQKRKFSIGASVGVVVVDNSPKDSSELLSRADMACYSAKVSGRNQTHLYSEHNAFQAQQNDELRKVKLLNYAMDNDGLRLHLQPIVATSRKDAEASRSKFEVLLRIHDEQGRPISPAELIPIAEKYDRMQHIDLWVVEQATHLLHRFQSLNIDTALSVNLSGNTLSNASCLEKIIDCVKNSQLTSRELCFEVTETSAIKGIDKVSGFIADLKALGCEFSLDDFGSGLSSFGYLKSLQVDYLKIDGSFVKNIIDDVASRAIVTSFNTLSHEMGMKTVAEYVENDAIAQLLTEMDIDYLQGYGVGVPRDAEEWLAEFTTPLALTGS